MHKYRMKVFAVEFLAFSLFSIEVPSSAYGRKWQRWLGCFTHQRCSLFIACRRAASVAWCSVVIAVDPTRDLSAVLHLPYWQSLWGNWASHVYHLGLQRVTNKIMYKQDSLYEMLLISLYFKGTALCWGPTWISRNFATDRCQRELWTKRSNLEGSNSSSSSKDSRFALSVAKSVSFTLFETFSRFCLMCENEKKIKLPTTTAIGHGREGLERKTSVWAAATSTLWWNDLAHRGTPRIPNSEAPLAVCGAAGASAAAPPVNFKGK